MFEDVKVTGTLGDIDHINLRFKFLKLNNICHTLWKDISKAGRKIGLTRWSETLKYPLKIKLQ